MFDVAIHHPQVYRARQGRGRGNSSRRLARRHSAMAVDQKTAHSTPARGVVSILVACIEIKLRPVAPSRRVRFHRPGVNPNAIAKRRTLGGLRHVALLVAETVCGNARAVRVAGVIQPAVDGVGGYCLVLRPGLINPRPVGVPSGAFGQDRAATCCGEGTLTEGHKRRLLLLPKLARKVSAHSKPCVASIFVLLMSEPWLSVR